MQVKLLVVALASLVSVPGLVSAQGTASCSECVIGIFDDEGLTRNFGNFGDSGGVSDSFYIGIRYDPTSSFDGLTGIEFSVLGMPTQGLPPAWTVLDNGTAVGPPTPVAPADTLRGTGGWNVVWSECQPGNKALVRISLVSLVPIPNDTVLWIKHRYPPLDDTFPYLLFTQCNFPVLTMTSARGGCFVLNPTVGPGESVGNPPCRLEATSVAGATWSSVKSLYR